MAAVATKAADVASATGSAVVLLVVVPVVPAAARFDSIAVLTVVGQLVMMTVQVNCCLLL